MPRLYREGRSEALIDLVVSEERAAEIMAMEAAKGFRAFAGFVTFAAKDERQSRGKFVDPVTLKELPDRHDFIVFNGQGVHHDDWSYGVVQEESDDGRFCTVLFFDELVTMPRQSLERIKYPKPEVAVMKDEMKGALQMCPSCGKPKLLVTVDSDGDIHESCTGRRCIYVAVWKSKARMQREYGAVAAATEVVEEESVLSEVA